MTDSAPQRRAGRRQLLLVASLFLVPLAAAVALYFSFNWRPAIGAHGQLIEPPRPLPAQAVQGQWSLVYLPGSDCDQRSRAVLAELGRLRIALGKDASRTRRVLLHAGECTLVDPASAEPDLLLLPLAGPGGAALRALFPTASDGAPGIYIVDPHGNLLMSYPATGSARGLLKDLERLLRLSSIG